MRGCGSYDQRLDLNQQGSVPLHGREDNRAGYAKGPVG